MILSTLDWAIVVAFFVFSLVVGVATSRRAGKNAGEFFLSGRQMPWWLLGVSMVATTFSSDTPNLVTDIVRKHGVSGNWLWWAFLLTGMLTVFVYAKLWRRSGVLTDLEFYELRYSGRSAAFLRGFRAIYLGVFFNVMIMATVSLAAIKIGSVTLGLKPLETLVIASVVTVIYSSLGGLRSVLLTDFALFVVAMVGSLAAAWVVVRLPEVGGLEALLENDMVRRRLDFVPDLSDPETFVPLFLMPLAVQWWSTWYPGAEPGGGGYIAQRMLAARNEEHAASATLFFNIAHYALRPWPWIIVALASLVVFPDLAALSAAFPELDANLVDHDLAYPAMLRRLPHGLLGIVMASLIAAYMSTISTHLNWGSSYIVNDFYLRFLRPEASERALVLLGRVSTALLMLVTACLALYLHSALQAFQILLQIGAGTGLLFIMRWFWWRVNAASEITAMVVSFAIAVYFQLGDSALPPHVQLLVGVSITTVSWLLAAFIAPPTERTRLAAFCRKVRPGGPGWRTVERELPPEDRRPDAAWDVPGGLLNMAIGCALVYGTLFATGYFIKGNLGSALVLLAIAVLASFWLIRRKSRTASMA
ncbi:MAG: Na+:solute symporter [Proteobacteria bacterium]|nr:Na+:solute symporter [Pseudomonadota bacterium]